MSIQIEKRICVKCNIGHMQFYVIRMLSAPDMNIIEISLFYCNRCNYKEDVFNSSKFESKDDGR